MSQCHSEEQRDEESLRKIRAGETLRAASGTAIYLRTTGLWLAETAQIAAALRKGGGLDFAFTILRYVAAASNEQECWDRAIFVLEPAAPRHAAPAGGEWVDRACGKHGNSPSHCARGTIRSAI